MDVGRRVRFLSERFDDLQIDLTAKFNDFRVGAQVVLYCRTEPNENGVSDVKNSYVVLLYFPLWNVDDSGSLPCFFHTI